MLLTTQVWVGGDGVFVSDDFGESWARRGSTRGIQLLLPSRWPQSDATVFAGTVFGLLRSRDGGKTFESTALNDAAVHRAEWPGPALVVACDRGVLVTTDEGKHFVGPGAGLPPGPVRAMVLSSFFGADPVIFASPASGGVYRSSDGGATWKPSGLAGETVGDFVWLGPVPVRRCGLRLLPQPGRGGELDATRREPGPAAAAAVPARAGGGSRGLPRHRPGALPHARRGRALGAGGIRRPGRADRRHVPRTGGAAAEAAAPMRFAKAHGLGNDFILVAAAAEPGESSSWAVRLCDRHRGIGGDGVVLHAPAPDGVSFRLINADGLPGEISGNGLRCLAALAVRSGWAPARHVVSTVVGPKAVEVTALAGGRYRIVTDLGPPALGSRDVPVALEPATASVVDHPLDVGGRRVLVTATSMGNPHCAVFLEREADDALLHELGPQLERHAFFPKRTNVEFVTLLGPGEIRVRFWERGVGYTMASGTGSASAAVASIITGRTGRTLSAVCDGGRLEIDWPEGGSVRQTGEVEILFEGDWLAD